MSLIQKFQEFTNNIIQKYLTPDANKFTSEQVSIIQSDITSFLAENIELEPREHITIETKKDAKEFCGGVGVKTSGDVKYNVECYNNTPKELAVVINKVVHKVKVLKPIIHSKDVHIYEIELFGKKYNYWREKNMYKHTLKYDKKKGNELFSNLCHIVNSDEQHPIIEIPTGIEAICKTLKIEERDIISDARTIGGSYIYMDYMQSFITNEESLALCMHKDISANLAGELYIIKITNKKYINHYKFGKAWNCKARFSAYKAHWKDAVVLRTMKSQNVKQDELLMLDYIKKDCEYKPVKGTNERFVIHRDRIDSIVDHIATRISCGVIEENIPLSDY